MAIKKSELYSSLWASCDALRGGMDASQYKDYVLVLLFIKYVSDKYADKDNALIEIPKGSGFKDMIALKGIKTIGDDINKKIIAPLAEANDLKGVIDVVDFNDDNKLGNEKEMVDRLTELISIFENPALDFSKNRAEGDDILGDAYEYLMRHFATQSGKSKGQFYTPAEVSRVMAKVLNIKNATNKTTFYDPTCGSASLLLKVLDEANGKGTVYGQEKDVATAALAKMNMMMHNNNTSTIVKGQSTLSNPLFLDKGHLKTFDYIVANPPFSLSNWTTGFIPSDDFHQRFDGFGIPPDKNGDYAFLLHIIKSLNNTGKAACILPHGVLFRGNAEAVIRKNLIIKGYIKGIIGLPANLFYGTGIPACIIVVDKENAETRKGIFMIDAGKGFMKDGNKNRLREQDIHKITDVFNKQLEVSKYSRFVFNDEISDAKNDYNLNIPRYIDSQEPEDIQDINAHLNGGIPEADLEALAGYWEVYPSLKKELFDATIDRLGYYQLKVEASHIRLAIFGHDEFVNYSLQINAAFNKWKARNTDFLKAIRQGDVPKAIIEQSSEDLLQTFTGKNLLDKYDIYQHIMSYWNEIMQDDVFMITLDGWKAETYRILIKNKQGKETDKGWSCDLVPPDLVISRYFKAEKENLEILQTKLETVTAQKDELVEEHTGEESLLAEAFNDKGGLSKVDILKRLKEITPKGKTKKEPEYEFAMAAEPEAVYETESTEILVLNRILYLLEEDTRLKKEIKEAEESLDKKVLAKYPSLSDDDIKRLVVDDKWMRCIEDAVHGEMERISQRLTQRIKELAERYETPLPKQLAEVESLEDKVNAHLAKMGFVWK